MRKRFVDFFHDFFSTIDDTMLKPNIFLALPPCATLKRLQQKNESSHPRLIRQTLGHTNA